MKLQKVNVVTLFIFLINTLSAHGMEQNSNELHPLLHLPAEIQQQIVFPWYTNDIKITKIKMDELKEVAKTFFVFNILSKDFNQCFKLPWSHLDLAKKNKMLKKVIDYMTVLDYKKYRTVPLALVYSGADADVKPKLWSTCLASAVDEDDELAVAMLLKHNANPYQLTNSRQCERICFHASTVAIAKLFLEKIDNKSELLSNLEYIDGLLSDHYSSEIMEFWFDYGVNPGEIYYAGHNCLFHVLVDTIYEYGNTIENILAKGELLLKHIPNMVNTINRRGKTPMDEAIIADNSNNCCLPDAHKALIKLLRQHGGKTAQELEEENAQSTKQQETSDDATKI